MRAFLTLLAGCAFGLFAPAAMARDAYVANSGDGSVSVLDLATNAPIATIAVGGKPTDVAITPDGKFAYVANEANGTVSVIDTGSRAPVGAPIAVGSEPRGVAIAPNGSRAYVGNSGDGTVSVIDTAAHATVGPPITVGAEPEGIAVSPDGSRAFVAQHSGDVSIIDTSTNTVIGSVPDALGPSRLAIGPRGGRGFVTNASSTSVTAFSPANGSVVGLPINIGTQPAGIAIEPGGRNAYVTSPANDSVTPIDTALDSVLGASITGFPGATGIAFAPDGLHGYVTNGGGAFVSLLDATRNAPAGTISAGSAPTAVAVVPNQGPHASFWVSPVQKRARSRLTFLASASSDPDGKIATYAWDFGDGKHAQGTSATRYHTYRRPGTYQVTLVTTDDEGCSAEVIYTGQTVSCNGSPAATATAQITVIDSKGPILRLTGGKKQRLRKWVKVFAQCPAEPCTVRARGFVVTTVERGGSLRSSRHRLGRAAASLTAGVWGRLALRVPGGTRRAVVRALRSGGEATAKLTVVATDETGIATLRKWSVKLIVPRRRSHAG